MKLTEREMELLTELGQPWAIKAGWARPMDLGASDASHHSGTLRSLVRKGYAERIPRSTTRTDIDRDGTGRSPSWLYRITEAGKRRREQSSGT